MTNYDKLLEFKKMVEERDTTEEKLESLRSNRIYIKNRSYGREYRIRETDQKGDFHDKKITKEQYSEAYGLNVSVEFYRKRLTELNEKIRNGWQKLPYLEEHVLNLYEKQSEMTKKMLENTMPRSNSATFKSDQLIHRTLRGEFMRSKTEAIGGDRMFEKGLFYEYEHELVPGELYPDFYVEQNIRERPVIWEHFGKMDDSCYVYDFLKKMEKYRSLGFYPGYNLITTFEYYSNEHGPMIIFDSCMASNIIKDWFLPEGVILSDAQKKNIKMRLKLP